MFWILQLSQTEETQRKNRFDREQQTKRMRVASQVGSAVGGTAAAMRNVLKEVQRDAQADTEQTGETEEADASTSDNDTADGGKKAAPTTSDNDTAGGSKKTGPTTSSLSDVLDKNQTPTRDTAAVPNTNEVGQNAAKNDQDQENKEWENKEWDARTADAKQKADEEEEWENKEWDARLAHAKAEAAKIPGAGAVEGFGKLFPILEFLIGPKFKPDTAILTKILCYAGTIFTVILVWPLLAAASLFKFRNFVFFKLPETTTIEVVASILPICAVLFIILIFSYFFICDPSLTGTIKRGALNLLTNVNINCGH